MIKCRSRCRGVKKIPLLGQSELLGSCSPEEFTLSVKCSGRAVYQLVLALVLLLLHAHILARDVGSIRENQLFGNLCLTLPPFFEPCLEKAKHLVAPLSRVGDGRGLDFGDTAGEEGHGAEHVINGTFESQGALRMV